MNFRTVFHLICADFRHHMVWFILYFAGVLFFPFPFLSLFIIPGFLLATAIGLESNLIRTTAHWKIRPVSGREWLISRIVIALIMFGLPYGLKQGLIMYGKKLPLGAVIHGSFEIWAIIFVWGFVVLLISSLANSWKMMIALVIGIFGTILLTDSVTSSIRLFYDHQRPEGTWHTEAIKTPNPWPWIVATLVLPLVITATLFLIQRSKVNSKITIAALFAGAVIYSMSALFLLNRMFNIELVDAPKEIKLERSPKLTNASNNQPLFEDVVISGLPEGAFVEARSNWSAYDRTNSNKKKFADLAALSLIPEYRLSLASLNYLSHPLSFVPGTFNPEKTAQEVIKTGQNLAVIGETYQWQKAGAIPFKKGTYPLKQDFSVKVEDIKSLYSDSGNRKQIKLEWYSPRIHSTKTLSRHNRRERFKPNGTVFLIATHNELNEAVLLHRNFPPRYGPSKDLLSCFDSYPMTFQLFEDSNWKILWPETGDRLAKWLSGAEMEIYIPIYLGRFDDSIEIPEI